MNSKLEHQQVIALLDSPSSESFGIVSVIIYDYASGERYASGLTSESSQRRIIDEREWSGLDGSGHILEAMAAVPEEMVNPLALWVGRKFSAKAKELSAPSLPEIDTYWLKPSEPNTLKGWFKLQEPAEAYKTLEDWVVITGVKALQTNSLMLAKLMQWAIPGAAETLAALYFTAPTEDQQRRELEFQERIYFPQKGWTIDYLKLTHEKTRENLLSKA